MIDLDQKLHRSITTLGESRSVNAPPVAWIVEAATHCDAGPRARRPRRVLVATVAGGLTLGLGGAALAGVLPGPVTDAFHRMSDWGGPCRIDKRDAHLVASTRTPDGSTLEWWESSTAASDHIDSARRVVAPGGSSHDLDWSCGPRMQATTKILGGGGSTTPTEVDLWGQAPIGTATLAVGRSDGSSVVLPLQGDRYFMGAFAAGGGAPHPIAVVARTSDGTVIDQMPVAP